MVVSTFGVGSRVERKFRASEFRVYMDRTIVALKTNLPTQSPDSLGKPPGPARVDQNSKCKAAVKSK